MLVYGSVKLKLGNVSFPFTSIHLNYDPNYVTNIGYLMTSLIELRQIVVKSLEFAVLATARTSLLS